MTVQEAKKAIFQKCRHCKWWSCAVWENGEPAEDVGRCLCNAYAWRDADEWACRSFDYAPWIVKKTIRESEADE